MLVEDKLLINLLCYVGVTPPPLQIINDENNENLVERCVYEKQ